MRAIILAAGYGGRMSPLTNKNHKTLLKINDNPIMDLIINSLLKNNINEIVVVTGYKERQLKNHLKNVFPNVIFQFIHNKIYDKTNNIFSLALAFEKIKFDKDIIMIESDLIYSEGVLEIAINSKHKNLALVSPYKTGLDGTVVEVLENKIIGLYPPHLQGQNFNLFDKYKTLNIYKFSKEFCENEFKKLLIYYANSIDDNCYYELILGILIYMQRQEIYCEIISNDKWVEVDDPNDLYSAEFHFNKNDRISILEDSFGGYWNYDITDFCFIRNMYFPSKSMHAEMKNNLPLLLENYGSKQNFLNQKLSYVLQYKKERLVVLNGAAQIYPIIADFLDGKDVLIPNPSFGEYSRVFKVRDSYKDNCYIDYNKIENKIKKNSNIVVVNPNNPSGSLFESLWIIKMIDKYPSKFFIVDESFIEFSNENSIISYLEKKPRNNVIVIRSMSKTYGLPGLRLGFIYSCDNELISFISSKVPIWNLNSVSEFFMEIILKNKRDLEDSFIKTKIDRDIFIKSLKKIKYVAEVFDSGANFILFKIDTKVIKVNLAQFLIKDHLIYIKDVSDKFNSPINTYYRVAVRLPSENESLVSKLKNVK